MVYVSVNYLFIPTMIFLGELKICGGKVEKLTDL